MKSFFKFFAEVDWFVWALLMLLLLGGMMLHSCGHYEPPGRDLWLTLQ